jgi:hypothetical protein
LSEKRSIEEIPELIRSVSFSAKSYMYYDAEWRHFAFEELSYHSRQISSKQPEYNHDVWSHQPRKTIREIPESNSGTQKLLEDESKRRSQEKHAGAEQDRRKEHKSLVIIQYRLANDYALETAGWDHNSIKPLTKELINACLHYPCSDV